uniref:Uncharacterized protein n=1 Tax=Pyrodinium bahamense TaxID=73915 RepID=A0A7S0FY29_9DINO
MARGPARAFVRRPPGVAGPRGPLDGGRRGGRCGRPGKRGGAARSARGPRLLMGASAVTTCASTACCSCSDEILVRNAGSGAPAPTGPGASRPLPSSSPAATPRSRDYGGQAAKCCESGHRRSGGGQMLLNFKLLFASADGDLGGIREALVSGADIETRRPLTLLPRSALGEEPLTDSMEDPVDFEEVLVLGDHGVFQSQGEVISLGPPKQPQAGASGAGEALTPLMRAAKEGRAKAVALLLDSGATPHAQAEDGMTPLHFAAAAGCRESCQALLRAGANRWVLDAYERDAFACLPQHWVSTREGQAAWLALLRPARVGSGAASPEWGQALAMGTPRRPSMPSPSMPSPVPAPAFT